MRSLDFAAQLNVSLANGWGIVRTVADLCLKMPEGKYVLVKDPNKVCVFLFMASRPRSRLWRTFVPASDWPHLLIYSAHRSFSSAAGHSIVCRSLLCIRGR